MDILSALKLWVKSLHFLSTEREAVQAAIKEIERLRDIEHWAVMAVAWELSGHDPDHLSLKALRSKLPKDKTDEMVEEVAKPGFTID